MEQRLEPYVEWFESYVQSFMHGTEEDVKYIALKHDHTLRVLENATLITNSLSLDEEQRYVALLGALFHDVGRFVQYETYRTFSDKNSVNHGLLGSRILKRENVLGSEPLHIQQSVRVAVALHNRLLIPAHLPQHFHAPLHIVRDSDKLDIFPVLVSNFTRDGSANDVVRMGVEDVPDAYSQKMVDDLLAGRLLKYSDMRYVNDFKLLLASWVFALQYTKSVELMHERGVMEDLLATLPEISPMEKVRDAVRAEIERVLQGA